VSVNPVNLTYGTLLANSQLSGTATWTVGGYEVTVPGTWSYTNAAGTVLSAGSGQSESVTFTPTDLTDYTKASATATINVLPGPRNPVSPTRTVLTALPRPATLGQLVSLTATVRNLARVGGTPIGSITFLDGTASLGTVALRRGRASLKTSSLHLGPNTIQAEYMPSQGFAPSTGAMVENVRARRSKSKAAPSEEAVKRAFHSTAMVIRTSPKTSVMRGLT
jgi:hypothetical protein